MRLTKNLGMLLLSIWLIAWGLIALIPAPLSRLLGILAANGALETLELAFPEDAARREVLHEFREAAPKRVHEILAGRRWEEPGIHKVGGDLIVPFERLPEMLRIYETGFERRGLDFAVWGHASDGNLHPNAIPKSAAEATLAVERCSSSRTRPCGGEERRCRSTAWAVVLSSSSSSSGSWVRRRLRG